MPLSPIHPLGSRAKVLLSSVFGPYAQDDEYGSRTINPMELYHNQVTRAQGELSLRMFHRSFGLMIIQANLPGPCTLLDFPTMDRFVEEIRTNRYDVIGISGIIPNVGKVKKMCELIRTHSPRSTIVVGGHVVNHSDIARVIDADHIVKGDGVRWFREYLGVELDAPVRHPKALSGFGTRILGHNVKDGPSETAAILIPSVGCPVGCNFCCTSALFGGKGHFVNFYETGDELFAVMADIAETLGTDSFFVLDENFLLHRKRALRLLELMTENDKSWSLYVFSSGRVIQSYTIDQLIGLGVSWVWMGLEGEESGYRKLKDVETRDLVRELQSHGIRVLGSSIIGLESHTPENIGAAIDYAVSHNTVFHQFMLYTPNPGTPLYETHKRQGTLKPDFPVADAHGQYRFNYHHPAIPDGDEEQLLIGAFQRDFDVNGPSLARLIRVTLDGYIRYRNHPDPRIRRRFRQEGRPLKIEYAAGVWAMAAQYRGKGEAHRKLKTLLRDIYSATSPLTRLIAPLAGRYLSYTLRRERRRLADGMTLEPRCWHEPNAAARALSKRRPETVGEVALTPRHGVAGVKA